VSQSIADSLPAPDEPATDPVVAVLSSRQSSLLAVAARLLKFGTVGGLGFLWDATTVYALLHVVGFTAAALGAYFVAATMNWMLNRLWTFRGRSGTAGLLRQWLSFLGANAFGFAINRAVVFGLVAVSPICLEYPILPLAAGSLAGMALNFVLSNRLVFRD
jgi:putative flippase GtrA